MSSGAIKCLYAMKKLCLNNCLLNNYTICYPHQLKNIQYDALLTETGYSVRKRRIDWNVKSQDILCCAHLLELFSKSYLVIA